ncbi:MULTISPECIES: DUF350 domain-containing protein [Snodgrassella]|uniref:DUF350 domain-containing protein n=1 Tax=Snodgrassella alvi TaxID=1196083 RepID=A0A2N9X4R4_9NEIS|nr:MULTISPECIES: DUF350 domain-containing protein [Snodgrassella]MCX8746543.1 DUF350 domain-containing protein [Snodgrassella sp. B3800]MCX8749341.1 DUF350 domain-containing protein [Snodgrassella sp. B3088]MCX8753989.1 DUF350 domain-containing protein [Snodgrassella sp. B3837]PIT38167.1 hypothetical protein BHC54_06310 [Snodgrassella alvi]PIT40882.1 hypothetical protein BHC43_01095 [Snodgrassella alvi]
MVITLWQYIQYLKYFGVALLLLIVFIIFYIRITPVAELKLIKQGNLACAVSMSGAMIGFCITLISSMLQSVNLISFIIWGAAAMIVQILVYFIATLLIPKANFELANNNIAVGALFFGLSVSIGILNAAALS